MRDRSWADEPDHDPELCDACKCKGDPNRPEIIESPWLKTVRSGCMALVMAGFLLKGLPGLIGVAGALYAAMLTMPSWASNNTIEQAEARWIAKRIQRHYDTHKTKVQRVEAANEAFDNPPEWLRTARRTAGWLALAGILLMLAGLVLKWFGLDSSLFRFASLLLWPGMIVVLDYIRRIFHLNILDYQARGGIETSTLRDSVLRVSRSPHRLLAFLISTLLIVVAGLLEVTTQTQAPLFSLIDYDWRLVIGRLSESFRTLV